MNEIKPTWKLAWGLFWKMFIMYIGFQFIINLIGLLLYIPSV